MKPAKAILQLLIFSTLVAGWNGDAPAAEIVVAMVEGAEEQTLEVPVNAINATGIVAAAFTVLFDTNALTITAASDFFTSFASQFAESGALDPLATSVTLEGKTYASPFSVTSRSNGMAIAGVRRLPSAGPTDFLFTLQIALKPGAAAGLYNLDLQPTTLRLAAAGYPAEGKALDLLIGRNSLAGTYPVVLAANGAAAHLVPGYVRFNPTDLDTDDDGIPDAWELLHFPNLTSAGLGTDSDGDGLLDVLEFFMGADPTIVQAEFILRGQRDGTLFKMLFPMRTAHDLDFDVEWSTDLMDWSSAGVTITARPDLGSGTDWAIHEASVPHGDASYMFLRLTLR